MTAEEQKALDTAADNIKSAAKSEAKSVAEAAVAEVKTEAEGAKAEAKTAKELAEAAKKAADAGDTRMDQIEAKIKRSNMGGGNDPEGESFLEIYSKHVDQVKSRERGKAVEFKLDKKVAVTMLTGPTLPGRLIPYVQGAMVGRENVFQHVRDLIAPGTISGPTLAYPRALAQEGGPAITLEGQKKPQMSFTFEEVIAQAKKIPVYFKLSTEMVADAPAFVSYMRAQAAEAIRDVEDTEMLYGDNTSTHLQGIFPLATAFDGGGITVEAPQMIDVLRLAVAQVRRAKFRATAIMMNPDDVAALELTKDAEGRYMLPTVLTGAMPLIGRVQIIEVDAINQGEFLVGAFDRGAQCFELEGLTIRIFDQNEDDAVKNLVTVVLEERLLQAVYRPASFVKGTFDTAITGLAAA